MGQTIENINWTCPIRFSPSGFGPLKWGSIPETGVIALVFLSDPSTGEDALYPGFRSSASRSHRLFGSLAWGIIPTTCCAVRCLSTFGSLEWGRACATPLAGCLRNALRATFGPLNWGLLSAATRIFNGEEGIIHFRTPQLGKRLGNSILFSSLPTDSFLSDPSTGGGCNTWKSPRWYTASFFLTPLMGQLHYHSIDNRLLARSDSLLSDPSTGAIF